MRLCGGWTYGHLCDHRSRSDGEVARVAVSTGQGHHPLPSLDRGMPQGVDLHTDPVRAGKAALTLPGHERARELFARLVDPAGMYEHGREILVTPALQKGTVSLGLRRSEAGAGKNFGPVELASGADDQGLDGRAERPRDRPEVDRLRQS